VISYEAWARQILQARIMREGQESSIIGSVYYFGPSLVQVGFGQGRKDPHHQSFELRIVLLNVGAVASFSCGPFQF